MARAITPRRHFDYVLREDQHRAEDDPERTVWTLRKLDIGEETEVQDVAASVGGVDGNDMSVRTGTIFLHTLRYGLVAVRNWLDENGKPVTFQRKTIGGRSVCPDDVLGMLSAIQRRELVEAITADTVPDVVTAGKSSAPPA